MQGGITRYRVVFCLAVAAALSSLASTASAQLLKGRLRQPEPEVEAISGEPFGVGRWVVQLPPGANPALLGESGFVLAEKNGRVRFQAFQAQPARAVAREILGRPQMATVYFLFTGSGPLELQLFTPGVSATVVTPHADPVAHARLLTDWWARYTQQANRLDKPADSPDIVDNYLLGTLSRRLNLPPASQVPPPAFRQIATTIMGIASAGQPSLPGMAMASGDDELDYQAGLLLGTDSLRSEMQMKVLARRPEANEVANQPLPAGLTFTSNVPEALGKVSIEPLAERVPPECFYIRFGNFPNYLWFHDTMERWSGDLKNLFNRRGLNYHINEKMERQLSLKQSVLSPILGPAVVMDVAMIGSDLFFQEGPAMGLLFQARNSYALNSDFVRQRTATLQRETGCTDEQVEIAGHKVSFLSTPDNRVRSFYAIDGDFHFVTNSRHLVARFFETAESKKSLGSSSEFRYARSLMPVDRNDTVFAYLPADFFRNLAGPHYQTEMLRRLKSAAEIDMALVAQQAARGQGSNAKSLPDLIAGQFLPEGFATRADGSRLELTDSGNIVDTIRGARGTFTPAPDVQFTQITAAEAERYNKFATWFQSKWAQLDPVMAAIHREAGKTPEQERVVLDVQLTPMAAKNYDTIASALGPIATERLAPIPGDAASLDISFSGNLLASKGVAQPQGAYRFFAGVRDAGPEVLGGGGAPANQPVQTVPAPGRGQLLNGVINGVLSGGGMPSLNPLSLLPPLYFGAYPTPALFAWLGVSEVPLDADGFGRSSSGLWQRRQGQYTTASMQRDVLEIVTPQLKFVPAKRPAQAWVSAGDLARSKLAPTINGLFYRAAKSSAAGNVQFLQQLATQLRVPVQDCLKVAQQLTDAELACPLGGTYKVEERPGIPARWISTALPQERTRLIESFMEPAPATYTAPLLGWLRQFEADLALDNRLLSLHADVEMTRGAESNTVAKVPTGPVPANGKNPPAVNNPPKPSPNRTPPLPQPPAGSRPAPQPAQKSGKPTQPPAIQPPPPPRPSVRTEEPRPSLPSEELPVPGPRLQK